MAPARFDPLIGGKRGLQVFDPYKDKMLKPTPMNRLYARIQQARYKMMGLPPGAKPTDLKKTRFLNMDAANRWWFNGGNKERWTRADAMFPTGFHFGHTTPLNAKQKLQARPWLASQAAKPYGAMNPAGATAAGAKSVLFPKLRWARKAKVCNPKTQYCTALPEGLLRLLGKSRGSNIQGTMSFATNPGLKLKAVYNKPRALQMLKKIKKGRVGLGLAAMGLMGLGGYAASGKTQKTVNQIRNPAQANPDWYDRVRAWAAERTGK